jgi:glycerophosphoryl diester phosphodiesterase
MEIVAHRGASGLAPENTLVSFREAVRHGAGWLEFDIRFSKDDVPIVIHDPSLKRTTNGRGQVRERTLAELRRLDAGSWFGAKFAAERIPTLDDLLKLASRVHLNLEIKARSAPAERAAELVWGRVREAGVHDRVLVTSFDVKILRALREIAPDVPLGFPWESGLRDPVRRALSLGCRMMLLDVAALSEKRVRRCREAGLDVWVYTVNDPEEMRRVMDLGVGGLVTDRPDLLSELVRQDAQLNHTGFPRLEV